MLIEKTFKIRFDVNCTDNAEQLNTEEQIVSMIESRYDSIGDIIREQMENETVAIFKSDDFQPDEVDKDGNPLWEIQFVIDSITPTDDKTIYPGEIIN